LDRKTELEIRFNEEVKMHLVFSLEGPNLIEIIKAVSQREPFKNSGKPDELLVDGEEVQKKKIPDNWSDRYMVQGIENIDVTWGKYVENTDFIALNNSHSIILHLNSCIKIRITDNPPETIQEVLDMIAPVPWTVASFGTTHLDWNSLEREEEGTDYLGPMIGNLQYNLGWGCAFKGEGHKRLVSERILDYGPWKVIRDEANDITLVQFYDLDADAQTALEQAKPGHELMGKYGCGALIHAQFKFYDEINGIYQPDKRKLEIVAPEGELPLTQIIDACKAKYAQSLGPEKPIDNVAFIFVQSEEDARRHLFDLWVRGLECWAFIDHLPARLDEDYTPPPPEKPEWVKRLELSPVA
jgi:hypothetical protein